MKKIHEKFVKLDKRKKEKLYRKKFIEVLDFRDFCFDLYTLVNWQMTIASKYPEEDDKNIVKDILYEVVSE